MTFEGFENRFAEVSGGVVEFTEDLFSEYWYDTPAKLKLTAETEQLLRGLLESERKYTAEEIAEYFIDTVRP